MVFFPPIFLTRVTVSRYSLHAPYFEVETELRDLNVTLTGIPKVDAAERKRNLYMSHFRRVHALLTGKMNLATMMWDDHVRSHPESLGEIPKDVRIMQWGYEGWHNFTDAAMKYASNGLKWWGIGFCK